MAISGLPVMLTHVLESLAQEKELTSWRMVTVKDRVTLTLNWNNMQNESHDLRTPVTSDFHSIGYRKRTPKQMSRDYQRRNSYFGKNNSSYMDTSPPNVQLSSTLNTNSDCDTLIDMNSKRTSSSASASVLNKPNEFLSSGSCKSQPTVNDCVAKLTDPDVMVGEQEQPVFKETKEECFNFQNSCSETTAQLPVDSKQSSVTTACSISDSESSTLQEPQQCQQTETHESKLPQDAPEWAVKFTNYLSMKLDATIQPRKNSIENLSLLDNT